MAAHDLVLFAATLFAATPCDFCRDSQLKRLAMALMEEKSVSSDAMDFCGFEKYETFHLVCEDFVFTFGVDRTSCPFTVAGSHGSRTSCPAPAFLHPFVVSTLRVSRCALGPGLMRSKPGEKHHGDGTLIPGGLTGLGDEPAQRGVRGSHGG